MPKKTKVQPNTEVMERLIPLESDAANNPSLDIDALEKKFQEEHASNSIYKHNELLPQLKLEDVILYAPHDKDTTAQALRILKSFNIKADRKNNDEVDLASDDVVKTHQSCFTVSRVRGNQINAGIFVLGVRNNIPELHGESSKPIARAFAPKLGDFTRIIHENINQSEHFYGAYGTYVLNVPAGHYVKAMSGNKPIMYGEGCHVIHDPNLSIIYNDDVVFDPQHPQTADNPKAFDANKAFINQSQEYIAHGTIHILRVPLDKFAKICIGNEAFILPGRKEPYVFNDSLFKLIPRNPDTNEYYFDQLEHYIQNGNIHILRIPAGKYAKVWIGQEAHILYYRSEPYVFIDPQFSLEMMEDKKNKNEKIKLFDLSDVLIEHGTQKILRIPQGKYVKAYLNKKPLILESKPEPYKYNDPLFEVVTNEKGNVLLWSQTDLYIHHDTIHRIRVPQGKFVKVYEKGSVATILWSQQEAYEFDDPKFRVELTKDNQLAFFDQTDLYIRHGTKHIIRVPNGKIATVWEKGSVARLLEASDKPYEFNDPNFIFDIKSKEELFFDATERLIKHGSIKRVIPHTGEVAISYNNGKLTILEAPQDGKPYIITDPNHEVLPEFLPVGIETLVFPSDETKRQRLQENKNLGPDEVSYECFTTRDSLKVGVKLLVAYKIVDPEKALATLVDLSRLRKHVENIAVVDMGKAIQQCSSQEFLNFYQTKPKSDKDDLLAPDPLPLRHYQDEVKDALAKDLREYGIELVRLNIETPKILDTEIANQMAQSSIQSARLNAEAANLGQSRQIILSKAQQEADAQNIAVKQASDAMRAKAEGELMAARLQFTKQIEEAETAKKTVILRAEGEAAATELRAKAQRMALNSEGEALDAHPALAELQITTKKVDALRQCQSLNVTVESLATLVSRAGFFAFPQNQLSQEPHLRALDAERGPVQAVKVTGGR